MPVVENQDLTMTQALADALLATLSAVPGAALLDTPECILFTNNVSFGPDTVLGDLTLATFTGYAPDALGSILGTINLPNGDRAVHWDVEFQATAAVSPPETAYGWAITNGAGTVLYGGGNFATPVPFVNSGDFLSFQLFFPQPRTVETGFDGE